LNDLFGTVPRSEETADRLAITEIIAAHSRGIDRLDVNCLKACYWPEATVDYGAFKGPAHQFAEIVMGALDGQYELTQHAVSNMLVQVDGDKAVAESYCNANHLLQGGAEELSYRGRYLDRFERRDSRWKLSHRQVVMDWSWRHPVVDERQTESFVDLTKGSHADDPVYVLLSEMGDS
jgi:hypothetical protein